MQAIFDKVKSQAIRRGQILLYEGDPISRIFEIQEGYVKVYSLEIDHQTKRTIFIYGPGDMFPMTSFLSGAGMTRYFYECMTDSVLKVMPQADFQASVKNNLERGAQLMSYATETNHQFLDRISALSAGGASAKVVDLLEFLLTKAGGERVGDEVKLGLPLTARDIAELCGLTRETVTHQLNELRRRGVISGSRVLCIKPDKLKLLK